MDYLKKLKLQTVGNLLLGGGLGIASGYSFHKYSQVSSMGFGVGFLATQMKSQIVTKVTDQAKEHLDFDQDGDVDLEDLEQAQEKYGINWIGGVSFVGGFGVGYLASKFM